MRLTCPACGAQCSVDAWSSDAAIRQAFGVFAELPPAIQPKAFRYLALFRSSGGRGLSWSRALRLLRDLRDLTSPGEVQWEGGEVRPAPPSLWAAAMDATCDRSPKALTNHNYLRHVAWQKAEELAVRAEGDHYAKAASRRKTGPAEEPRHISEATEAEKAKIAEMIGELTKKMGG